MIRGDVCWHRFRRPDKRRPILILTRDSAIPYMSDLTVAPITGRLRGIPSEVPIGPAEGMREECVVNLDHVHTVSKKDIGRLITHLSPLRMAEARAALLFALGFDE